jgi:hypothetical protein
MILEYRRVKQIRINQIPHINISIDHHGESFVKAIGKSIGITQLKQTVDKGLDTEDGVLTEGPLNCIVI